MELLLEKFLRVIWSNVLPTSPNRTVRRIIFIGEEKLERELLGLPGLALSHRILLRGRSQRAWYMY